MKETEYLSNLIYRIASAMTTLGDAEYLRDRLTAWLNVIVARGEVLGDEDAEYDQGILRILDALDEMQL